jgi:hypothetical protein
LKEEEWDEPYFHDIYTDGLYMPKSDQKVLEKGYIDNVLTEMFKEREREENILTGDKK